MDHPQNLHCRTSELIPPLFLLKVVGGNSSAVHCGFDAYPLNSTLGEYQNIGYVSHPLSTFPLPPYLIVEN